MKKFYGVISEPVKELQERYNKETGKKEMKLVTVEKDFLYVAEGKSRLTSKIELSDKTKALGGKLKHFGAFSN
ncbi:hypothetical protein [Listeria phage List-36]|uniref:Uncharacterized protein n=14 Tax=Pecentumvirus TaxID=1857844 RepID=S4U6U5_9CAUD|nr:hypothetical protein AG2_053 [Listeria phage vB_LmoM_AG20]YP_008240043.1 hypothetical protein QLX35_gp189 [Listeria phage LP-125]YP_009043489.1 hypothetical protein HH35_gp170 [Listeria phage List-36]YP_009044531.1 hypothetical protein LP083-2_075 [Listeria phage LP-083-2]YP_009592608.1 hypothetical protein FDG78_gp188 [Listeria phage LP-064]YP_009784696.1 hypothetical protein QLX40_gp188 [Listeria phage LP-124]YP_010843596.1 hypothetical protein PI27_gp029 [Listeria phage WIL-1]YP_406542